MTPSHQRTVIDGIRAEYGLDPATGSVANTLLYTTLGAALETLSDTLNSDVSHFLLELVQNADDLTYLDGVHPVLRFELVGSDLAVVSNENGFIDRDVRAICAAGMSTKAGNEETTGEKGIGFKSLFKAVDEVTISSKGYHFQFSRARACGLVIPMWKELPQKYQRADWKDKTIFVLHFENEEKLAKVKADLQTFDAKMLLFLRRLRAIEVKVDGEESRVTRSDSQGKAGALTQLQAKRSDGPEIKTIFATVSHTCRVTVADAKRPNRQQTTVLLAFPLEGEAEGQAYNYLPICHTGLPFLVQADFILVGSREALDNGHEHWNQMLFNAVAKAFVTAVQRFHGSPDLRYTWLRFLPLTSINVQFRPLVTVIQTVLRKASCLLTQEGDVCVPSDGWLVPEAWRDSSGPLVQCPGLRPSNISVHYKAGSWKCFDWLGCRDPTTKALLMRFKYYLRVDDGKHYHEQSPDRHVTFARVLRGYKSSDLAGLPIVPLKDGRWIAPLGKSVFYSQSTSGGMSSIQMPRGLPEVEIVHPDYGASAESPLHRLYLELGVKEAGVAEISRIIKDFHATRLKGTKPTSTELVEQLLYLFQAWKSKKFFDKVPEVLLINAAGKPLMGARAYCPKSLCRSGLDDILQGTVAADYFIHFKYLQQIAEQDLDQFTEWLKSKVGALAELRICSTGEPKSLTPEFQQLVARSDMPKVKILEIVVDAWDSNFSMGTVPESVLSLLKHMTVVWMKGVPVKLENAFLPTKAVKQIVPEGMPFLDVPSPEHLKWRVLKDVGVVTEPSLQSSEFWLSCLHGLMQQKAPQKAAVIKVYKCLDKCEAGNTRKFFQTNAAVFIPSQQQWITSDDSIWQSKVSLRHKCALSAEYPNSLDSFFRSRLMVQDAHIEHVVDELKLWSRKDDPDLDYLKSLVLALANLHEASLQRLGESAVRDNMMKLRTQAIMPVTKTEGGEQYREIATMDDKALSWFLVDSLRLRDAFQDKVWVADFTLEESTKIGKWMRSLSRYFPNLRPSLTHVVTETPAHGGLQAEVTDLTGLLTLRSAFIGSVAAQATNVPHGLIERLGKLRNAQVHSTSAITTRFNITSNGRKLEGEPEQKADIMLEETASGLHVLISGKAAAYGRLPPGTEDHLCHYLGLTTDKDIRLVNKIMTAYTEDDVRDLLVKHEIPITVEMANAKVQPEVSNDGFQGPMSAIASATGSGRLSVMSTPSAKAAVVATSNMMPAQRPSLSSQANERRTYTPNDTQQGLSSGNQTVSATITKSSVGDLSQTASSSGSVSHLLRAPDNHLHRSSTPAQMFGSGPRRTNGGRPSPDAELTTSEPEAGTKGEFLAYNILKYAMPSKIGPDNWTSGLRHVAEPKFAQWRPTDDTTFFADITVIDTDGTVRQWLEANSPLSVLSLPEDKAIRFNIEFKSTSNSHLEAFHMSDWQFEAARKMWESPEATTAHGLEVVDVFLLFTVRDVLGEKPEWRIIPDFFDQWLNGSMAIRASQGLLVWEK